MKDEITELYVEYTELKSKIEKVTDKIHKIHRHCEYGDSVCDIIRETGFYNCITCNKQIKILGKEQK